MTNIPHPPGHDEAMEIAIKTGLRALHETKGAFWERNDSRSDAMCLAYLAAMRPQIEREEREKALQDVRSALVQAVDAFNSRDSRSTPGPSGYRLGLVEAHRIALNLSHAETNDA